MSDEKHNPFKEIEQKLDELIAAIGGAPDQDPVQKELSNIIGTLDQIQHDQNEQYQVLNEKLDQIIALLKSHQAPTETVSAVFERPTPKT